MNKMAARGEIKKFKEIQATMLWRKMLSRLFETGHPWITFKDPCNIRSPQDHVGVVHSSNLCTEITLNTSADETAVCNLGSINLAEHIVDGKLDEQTLAQTIEVAMRMLDNVIDINFYPTVEAQNANFRHRPVGLGIMGLQDAFYKLDVEFGAAKALEVSDYIMETVSYYAILASSNLQKNEEPINHLKVLSGIVIFSRKILSRFLSKNAGWKFRLIKRANVIGPRARTCERIMACAILIVWQLRQRQRFLILSDASRALSRFTKIFMLKQI